MKILSHLVLVAGFVALYFLKDSAHFVRLLASSLGMIWVIKVAALLWQRSDGVKLRSPLGFFVFILMWPGVSLKGFTDRGEIPASTG